ncbi:MAG: AAA family ATPase [Deltaproteobacteria bacterium]|nr:AAA family ATPase [Deltaproteobacteria bacterium]
MISKNQTLIPFGLVRRKENDHIQALNLAYRAKGPDTKSFVVEKVVEFDEQAPAFSWEVIAPVSFKDLPNDHVQVSQTIAATYNKYFDFDNQQGITRLIQPKKTKQRLRGMASAYEEMVGRQDELQELKEILDQSFQDRGQVTSIIGDGGLGKTRLWIEFEKHLEEQQVLYFFGSFAQHSSTDYSAFRQILIPFVQHFKQQLTFSKPQQYVLDYILSPNKENKFVTNLSRGDLEQNILLLIRHMLAKVSMHHVAFILDDIHWADEKSKQLLSYLMPSIQNHNHMWLLIHRPTYQPPFDKEFFYHRIQLRALSKAQVESQIKNMLQFTYISPSTLEKVYQHSKGNPFFVEEIFRHSLENKMISKDNPILQELALEKSGIPMNIQAMVQTRLDHLPSQIFLALKKLCILGYEVYREEAVALLGSNGEDIIHQLLQESFLIEISIFPEDKIGFYHSIIFETLRENNISDKEKQQFHDEIATFLLSYYNTNDQNSHIIRICRHLLKIPYQQKYYTYFSKAAALASQRNNFNLTATYLTHLLKNEALDKKQFPAYANALNNTDQITELESFLDYWSKSATVKTEDPNTGYYYILFTFLNQSRKMPHLQKIGKKILAQYREFYTDMQLNALINEYAKSFAAQYQWDQYTHIALQQLRLFNNAPYAIEKVGYSNELAKYTINIADMENKLALNFINKSIRILKKKPEIAYIKYQLILLPYATFQTVHRCNYKLSTSLWKKIIEIRVENGILSDLDNAYSKLLINQFFSGQYDACLESYKKTEELTQGNRTRFYYNMTFWLSLVYLILGDSKMFKKQIIIARRGRQNDPWFRTIRFYCMAHYHLFNKNYYNAYNSFNRLLHHYKKAKANYVVIDTALLAICAKAEYEGRIHEKDIPDIQKWLGTKFNSRSYNHWSFQMHILTLARFIDIDFGIDPLNIDPAECPNAFLKQRMYLEKIKLLKQKKMHKQVQNVLEEYEKYRKKLELKIPSEYIKTFQTNSLFMPPL